MELGLLARPLERTTRVLVGSTEGGSMLGSGTGKNLALAVYGYRDDPR